MGLFSRRKASVAEIEWMPGGVDELEGDDAGMDDDGQASPFAYRVEHDLPNLPGPEITIWTYVSYTAAEGVYSIGLRYLYSYGDDPGWAYVGYVADPEGEEFGSVDEADATAAEWASAIAGRPGDWQPRLPDVFEWDGEPFPVGDPG